MQKIRIGLLGLGQIGTGLFEILKSKKSFYKKTLGVDFEISRIAVKNTRKKRSVKVGKGVLTNSASSIFKDPEIDIVVELVGGVAGARKLVTQALKSGKHVVTANKALIAEHGDELFKLASKNHRWLFFEASVGGGIPVIKNLRESLAANKFDSIYSIINGTSNYILSSMTEEGSTFGEALKEAQVKGYAEADPTLDIDGTDAAHKIAILAKLAFRGSFHYDSVYKEGITNIQQEDIAFAREFGYRIKLLAIAKKSKEGVEARVQPTLVPESHILAHVNGSYNAVLVNGDEVGHSLMYGKGAGPHPTASAVISDLIDIAKHGLEGPVHAHTAIRSLDEKLKVKKISNILSRYYLRVQVIDQPGVLASISQILGKNQISISDLIQKERSLGKEVPLIMLTHDSHEKNLRSAVEKINKLPQVKGKSQVIRIEE